MTIWWLAAALSVLGFAGLAFIWLAVRIGKGGHGGAKGAPGSYEEAAEQDVEHIFNEQFREELRNRGRLHFEKIIGENAMFLQQDLRLTTSQLNEYMKTEITNKLQEEFAKYEQSIMDAKQLAIDSIEKTNAAVDEQRQKLSGELRAEIDKEKANLLKHFEDNMADVVNHYVLAAVGGQIDLSDQLEYILSELEANKQAIIEDIQSGA
jgi:NTP pyrophosphatase (non-canonical NTP hydrolase)